VRNLVKADLRGANVQRATLFASDLEGSSLTPANRIPVQLRGSNLKGWTSRAFPSSPRISTAQP